MRWLLALALTQTVLLPAVFAQTASQKPGLEQKRLDYFAGSWVLKGNRKPSAFGPAGEFTVTENNQWMEGGFFLVERSLSKTPSGRETGMSIMGYDPEAKTYTYHEFTSGGEHSYSTGVLEGGTWTWTHDGTTKAPSRERFTVKTISPTSYAFKFETAPTGADWSIVTEGTAIRTR